MNQQILHLPVSGLDVCLRSLEGAEDLLLSEAAFLDTSLAIELLTKITRDRDGLAIDPGTLSIADLDTLLLLTRQRLFGDRIRADAICPADDCGAKIEVSFQIEAYLDHYRPRKARGVELTDEIGWFRFQNVPVSFRLPTGADLVAIARHPHPEHSLSQRCIRPANLPAKQRRRVEKAMETMAPSLAQLLQGQCTECSAIVEILFDPQQFVLKELRHQALFIYEEIHLLAMYYKWSEVEILSLPRSRRRYYADMIRQLQKYA